MLWFPCGHGKVEDQLRSGGTCFYPGCRNWTSKTIPWVWQPIVVAVLKKVGAWNQLPYTHNPAFLSTKKWQNENMFFADPTFKKSIKFLANLKYQISIEKQIPFKLYKRIPFRCDTCPLPLLWHEFDNYLCNLQSKVSGSLHMYFLLTNRKQIKILIYILYWQYDCCFLVFSIWVSHALEITIHFCYTTLGLFCSSFTQCFTHSKLCLPNPFLHGATPPPPPPS
jgi:hypothetical protein